jgi:hypothetical protein
MNEIKLDIIYRNNFFTRNKQPEWLDLKKKIVNKSETICKGLLKKNFGRALEECSVIFVANHRDFFQKNDEIVGILIANLSTYPGFFYIDVVCANYKGVGGLLIEKAEEISRNNFLKGLVLSSMPDVIGYYRKLGFENKLPDCAISEYKKIETQDINSRDFLTYLTTDKNCSTISECNQEGYIMVKCFSESEEEEEKSCLIL